MKTAVSKTYRSVEAFLVDHVDNALARAAATLLALVDLRREATSVVWGRYYSRSSEHRAAITSLRRDVHRLEKGLVMRPRRVPFGRDYVPALVSSMERLHASNAIPEDDKAWAIDVLSMYFQVCSTSDEDWLVDSRRRFEALEIGTDTPLLVPAARSQSESSEVSFDGLNGLARRRRSVRWFLPAAVDPAVVDRALQLAAQAPSACNRQNIRFHMIYGAENTSSVLRTVGGTRGFADQVPAVAVLIGRLAGYRYAFDRHAIYIDGGLASMGFLFALETLGLSSCCINWPDVGSRYSAIRKLVELRPDEQVLMLIAIGSPDEAGLVPSSHKRALADFRTS